MTTSEHKKEFESLTIGKLLLINKLLQKELEEGLQPQGLSATQAKAICTLSRLGPMNQRQLAGQIQVEPASLVRVIDLMEKSGLLTREKSPGDRRAHLIKLTPKGTKLEPTMWENLKRVDKKLTKKLKPEEKKNLENGLNAMMASLSKELEEMTGFTEEVPE